MPIIRIPSQLRPDTDGKDAVTIEAGNVSEAIAGLVKAFPALKERLYDEKGNVRRYVNIYLGDEDVRFLDNMETSLNADSEISLVPAIAGGSEFK